jgi:Phospholipase_D-nuclease N-terminal
MSGLAADDRFPVGALVPLILLGVAFVAYCLVDLARSEVRYLPKWAWALICVASVPVGGLIYLLVGRQPR